MKSEVRTVQMTIKEDNKKNIITGVPMKNSHFRSDQSLNMYVQNEKDIPETAFRHRTLEEHAAEFGGTLGDVQEFDWSEPRGREVW